MTIDWRQCPHDGGRCHHACYDDPCIRYTGGMALTEPHEGYPLPGYEPKAKVTAKLYSVGGPDREIEIKPNSLTFDEGPDHPMPPVHLDMALKIGFPHHSAEVTIKIETPDGVYHGTIRRSVDDGDE